jgi:signal transduction histidine kinase
MKKRLVIIASAFTISFFVMGALSLFSIERLNKYIYFSRMADKSATVIEKIFTAEKALRDIDRSERGYMITRDTMYLRFLNSSCDSLRSSINDLKQQVGDNTELLRTIALLNAEATNRISASKENIAFVDSSKSSTLSKYYYDSRQLMLDCSRLLKKIHTSEAELKAANIKGEQVYEILTTRAIKWLLLVFCIITFFLLVLLIKELSGRMKFQEELQARVIDLRRSHEELQQIAYVAAHDLQEPLRKIQVFSNMLLYQKNDGMSNTMLQNLERINNSANRMQSLITDLSGLTSLTRVDEERKEIDLNRTLQYIILDIDEKVSKRSATITVKYLPFISGFENQIKLLFHSLLDNSLKFCRPEVSPQILITSDITNGEELKAINPNLRNKKFNRVIIADNGIGFEQQFIDKMFQIFQRLHQPEENYEGKGIGLALCQRVMANHEGYIVADGHSQPGAVFKLYFPIA